MSEDKDLDLNRTAADESGDLDKAKRPTVTVTCSRPNGIVLNNFLDREGKVTTASNRAGGPITVKGSVPDVDKAFWDAWAANNVDLVNQGIVSAVPTEEIQQNEREQEDRG